MSEFISADEVFGMGMTEGSGSEETDRMLAAAVNKMYLFANNIDNLEVREDKPVGCKSATGEEYQYLYVWGDNEKILMERWEECLKGYTVLKKYARAAGESVLPDRQLYVSWLSKPKVTNMEDGQFCIGAYLLISTIKLCDGEY